MDQNTNVVMLKLYMPNFVDYTKVNKKAVYKKNFEKPTQAIGCHEVI